MLLKLARSRGQTLRIPVLPVDAFLHNFASEDGADGKYDSNGI